MKMMTIKELEAAAARVETSHEEAVAAMLALSVIYGDGGDLFKALDWAEKAAYQDSPDGYLQISRVVGSACIATEDYKLKMEYASYTIGTCDIDTLRRFGRADIAYNVGSICEYMAQYHDEKGNERERRRLDMLAEEYYLAATDMDQTDEETKYAVLRVVKRNSAPTEPQQAGPPQRHYQSTYRLH